MWETCCLKEVSHFQAIAMLARALFELAVDVSLINAVPDSVKRDADI
jgi:hypothetical protein